MPLNGARALLNRGPKSQVPILDFPFWNVVRVTERSSPLASVRIALYHLLSGLVSGARQGLRRLRLGEGCGAGRADRLEPDTLV